MKNAFFSFLFILAFGIYPGNSYAAMADYPSSVDEAIAGWPSVTSEAATKLIEKYGQPDSISKEMLLWNDTAPFKRTILYRDSVKHNFPETHDDFLEQVIDYKVPLDRYDDMAKYDGSVVLNRTAGEMSAKCHMVEANVLALNLAHKVARGELKVLAARKEFTEAIRSYNEGSIPASMQELQFEPTEEGSADPDESTMD